MHIEPSMGMSFRSNCATSTISKLNAEVSASSVIISEIAERRDSPSGYNSILFTSGRNSRCESSASENAVKLNARAIGTSRNGARSTARAK